MTNLAVWTGVDGKNYGWIKGGNHGVYDELTGDLIAIGANVAASRNDIYVSQRKGTDGVAWPSLPYVDTTSNFITGMCMTSDGKLHVMHNDGTYSRIAFTRSGGHIVSYSYEANSITVPYAPSQLAHYYAQIKAVKNGLGNEVLFITSSDQTATGIDLSCQAMVTTNVTPTSKDDFYSLSGVAGVSTQVRATTHDGPDQTWGNDEWFEAEQHPQSSVVYAAIGQHKNETIYDASPVGYYPISPNAGTTTWSVGSWVEIGRGAIDVGPPWMLWGVRKSSSGIYIGYTAGESGSYIDRIDSTGARTTKFTTIDSGQDGIGVFDVSSDSRQIWASYILQAYGGTGHVYHSHYADGTWNRVLDTSKFASGSTLSGWSQIGGTGAHGGLVTFADQDNTQGTSYWYIWCATQWASGN